MVFVIYIYDVLEEYVKMIFVICFFLVSVVLYKVGFIVLIK